MSENHPSTESEAEAGAERVMDRRTFLRGTAATVGTAAVLSSADGTEIAAAKGMDWSADSCMAGPNAGIDPENVPIPSGSFETPGHPRRSAYRSLAETERRFSNLLQQNGDDGSGQGSPEPEFDRVVDAVEDLGADPTGQQPVNSALQRGVSDGTLIVLPSESQFLLNGDLHLSASGTFGLVGEGYEDAEQPPGEDGARFVAAPGTQARITTGAVDAGLFGYFLLDQSAADAGMAILGEAEQFCLIRDVQLVGVQDSTGTRADEERNSASCALIAHNESAVVRVQRFYASNTGLPGDKNLGGVPALWVGRGNKGLAEIVQCQIVNSADNGIYASRTPGDVHIIGGAYINNEVSQIRYAGKGSWANGVTLMIDVDQYNGPMPSDFNTKISTNGVKTEMPSHIDKPGGAGLENAEIIGQSARNIGSLIFVRGHAGTLTMRNCRVVNNIAGTQSLLANPPGSSYDPATRPPHAVAVTESTFAGAPDSTPTIEIRGRPGSTVTSTCIKTEGAGPGDIQGTVDASGNSFGPECNDTGTTGPVGAAVDAAVGAYEAVAGAIGSFINQLFEGAAVIATVPFVVILIVGVLALLLATPFLMLLVLGYFGVKVLGDE